MKHAVMQHPSGLRGWYKYRDITILRKDHLRAYTSHWQATVGLFAAGTERRLYAATRAALMRQIDAYLDAQTTGKDA